MIRALVVSTALTLLACGPVIAIGGECTSRDACPSSQSCITAAPAGFCTKSCVTEGSIKDCPGGTVCTYFGASLLVCSTFCTDTAQCRSDYQCAELAGTESAGKKACQPATVVR